MHMFAKCHKNIPCGSRVMNNSTYGDGRTPIVIIVQIQGLCNSNTI